MTDLASAHVEAVARVLEDTYGRHAARQLLTSTDPAVHEALLAALVRAGVLSEARADALCSVCRVPLAVAPLASCAKPWLHEDGLQHEADNPHYYH